MYCSIDVMLLPSAYRVRVVLAANLWLHACDTDFAIEFSSEFFPFLQSAYAGNITCVNDVNINSVVKWLWSDFFLSQSPKGKNATENGFKSFLYRFCRLKPPVKQNECDWVWLLIDLLQSCWQVNYTLHACSSAATSQ